MSRTPRVGRYLLTTGRNKEERRGVTHRGDMLMIGVIRVYLRCQTRSKRKTLRTEVDGHGTKR